MSIKIKFPISSVAETVLVEKRHILQLQMIPYSTNQAGYRLPGLTMTADLKSQVIIIAADGIPTVVATVEIAEAVATVVVEEAAVAHVVEQISEVETETEIAKVVSVEMTAVDSGAVVVVAVDETLMTEAGAVVDLAVVVDLVAVEDGVTMTGLAVNHHQIEIDHQKKTLATAEMAINQLNHGMMLQKMTPGEAEVATVPLHEVDSVHPLKTLELNHPAAGAVVVVEEIELQVEHQVMVEIELHVEIARLEVAGEVEHHVVLVAADVHQEAVVDIHPVVVEHRVEAIGLRVWNGWM